MDELKEKFLNLTFEEFKQICILSGTDYNYNNYSKNINLILLKKISKPLLNNTYPKIKIEKFLNTLINK